MSLRDQIAARRAVARASPARKNPGFAQTSRLDDKTIPGQVSKARRSGKLDLASLELSRIPADVYTDLLGIPEDELSNPPSKPDSPEDMPRMPGMPAIDTLALDDINDEDARARAFGTPPPKKPWSEPEELTSFKAGINRIREVDTELGLFGGLRILDLNHNELTSLPDSIADLLQLEWIDLSFNAFTAIPPALLLLPKLEVINLANNAVSIIDLSSPIKPSEEGLSYGTGFLISAFERRDRAPKTVLPVLRTLNLAHNKLSNESLTGFTGKGELKLRVVTLSHNKLSGVLDIEASGLGPSRLPELASLVLDGNSDLHDIEGDLAEGCALKMEDCGYTRTGGGIGSTPPRSPMKKPANGAAAAYEPTPGGPSDIPNPSATVTFITHPAASFDSEPLALEMDVYVPASSSGTKHPVVIWWHGGGLLQGNKENLPPHLRRLPNRALGPKGEHVIVVSPNYRLAPQAPILDILADVDAAITFTRTALDTALAAKGVTARVDADRIVLSGGSAGGYLALMAGLPVPASVPDADVGGYRGPSQGFAPLALAPFYPITDLEHVFWATETDPVPWWPTGSVPDAAAQPHLNTRDPPVGFAVSGGPRSILYPYMLQHALFPSLLFRNQRSCGHGLEGYRPSATSMSVTTRARILAQRGVARPPIFLAYGTVDDKIQPLEESIALLRATQGSFELDVVPGADHAYDEDPAEQCERFAAWLEGVI
ncbi:hypothetical protein CspeluHIS016_0701840 [Cutaneotrichosporon spelunceum]|uniref:BD-FAE-like domain-containing protein n=1 Tax=Cutaneotrichosporon spelunceum TaxID=1672016 RepID=A0AAD3YEM4_9TREE|nr:hypothetical protein CspeluHIS016_0701840 [Cutaneotrichosporon spelunceum]